jgi:hypothetical protein
VVEDDEELSKMTMLEEEGDPLVVPVIIEIGERCTPRSFDYY